MNSFRKELFKLGEILRSQMDQLKMTPEIFAELMGFSVEKVNETLNGTASLSYDDAYHLELFTDVYDGLEIESGGE